jgi:thiol-disulfide isomerase/thioredoxin
MRAVAILFLITFLGAPLWAQEEAAGPSNDKAQKSYKHAMDSLKQHRTGDALEGFKKADKLDGGRCKACQKQIIDCALELGEWKAAETAAQEMVDEAQSARNIAIAHFNLGIVLFYEASDRHKDQTFEQAHEEMTKALAAAPNFPQAIYHDGIALAHLNQDAAAKAQFERYIQVAPTDDPSRQRALLFIQRPEMARAKMAPAFAVTTLDGRRVTLDDLRGNVVLIDFWATWCGPCREALPRIRDISRKFEGQPLVILSVSLDTEEAKWKDFVANNHMTWLNCRDGGFNGPMAKLFDVHAIPHTFTIDADGVLQDEHVGDAAIASTLKKQIARARELQAAAKTTP